MLCAEQLPLVQQMVMLVVVTIYVFKAVRRGEATCHRFAAKALKARGEATPY